MCAGIAVALSELPLELMGQHQLWRRVHDRGGESEVRFLYHYAEPRLPVWVAGELRVVRWGNEDGLARALPRTGWTWQETVERGQWSGRSPEPVEIPATMGLEGGIWFRIRQGIRGLTVVDDRGQLVVYMICVPSSHYYHVMTRSRRMPLIIGEAI